MFSKLILAALLASPNVLAAPAVAQGSPATIEQRSFDAASYPNVTYEVDLGKRGISLRGEYARRNVFGLRTPEKDHDGDKK